MAHNKVDVWFRVTIEFYLAHLLQHKFSTPSLEWDAKENYQRKKPEFKLLLVSLAERFTA